MADAKISTFTTRAANICTFTYAYVAANGAYGKVAINASGGLPVYTATALTPYADDTNAIGTSSHRWNSLVLTLDATIVFDDGAGNNNRFTYTDGTGPTFTDKTVAAGLTFNVQGFTNSHTATWQDGDGTVAYLENCFTAPLVITAASGGSTTIGVNLAANQVFVFHSAALMAAYTINTDGGSNGTFAGQELSIVFNNTVTSLTLGGTIWSSAGLAVPTAAVANQPFKFSWDVGSTSWIRYQ